MSSSLPSRSQAEVTQLLLAWRDGHDSAFHELLPLVESELRQLAGRYMRGERPGHVLQPTALVNEACIRLLTWRTVDWRNRAHFVAMAARLMRHVLVDMWRHQGRDGNGRRVRIVDIAEADLRVGDRSRDLVAIDDALRALAALDPRKAQIVELRFFGGLTLPEIAEAMEIAPVTVSREWAKARAWLHREVRGTGPSSSAVADSE